MLDVVPCPSPFTLAIKSTNLTCPKVPPPPPRCRPHNVYLKNKQSCTLYSLFLYSTKKTTTNTSQGYGIYTWPNGDVFMGQWVDGVRHGGGIFRSADGREYIGAWAGNVREGHGVRI